MGAPKEGAAQPTPVTSVTAGALCADRVVGSPGIRQREGGESSQSRAGASVNRPSQGSRPDLGQGLHLCSPHCFLLTKGLDYAVTPGLVDLFPVKAQILSDGRTTQVMAFVPCRLLSNCASHRTMAPAPTDPLRFSWESASPSSGSPH